MKTTLKRILKKVLAPILPKKSTANLRKELKTIPIGDDLTLLVYWKVLKIGKGPAVVLKAYETELLKFDCFGQDKGHYHIAPAYEQRIYFIEDSAIAQIQRTIKELQHHAQRYIRVYPDPRIQVLTIDPQTFPQKLGQVEKTLYAFLDNNPVLQDI